MKPTIALIVLALAACATQAPPPVPPRPPPVPAASRDSSQSPDQILTTYNVIGSHGTYATFGATDPGAQIAFAWQGPHPGQVTGSVSKGFTVTVPTDTTAHVVKA